MQEQSAEIARLKAENEGLKKQLQSAEEQIADLSNASKQNNIFKHIFGQDKK